MKVLAAMSGGVDSAVAAARAVEAGHDVTGIHLALSRNPASYRSGARGCCTLEDANDARRAADVIGIPFYVWDLSDRFHEDVVDDFMDEYAAGRTPNPCLRCNEKIKFAAVLDRALALGFDAVATGHYAQLRTGRADGGWSRCTGRSTTARTSPTCSACSTGAAAALAVPARRLDQGRGARGGRRARLLVADKPDSHDICFVANGDTAGWLSEELGDARPTTAARSSTRPARSSARHDGHLRLHDRPARGLRLGRPAPDGRPRFVLDIEPVSGTVTVGPHERLAVHRLTGIRPRWCGTPPPGSTARLTVQLRAHGAEHRAVVTVGDETVDVELLDPAYGIAPGQAAVVYDGTRVVGSATIASTVRSGA